MGSSPNLNMQTKSLIVAEHPLCSDFLAQESDVLAKWQLAGFASLALLLASAWLNLLIISIILV